MSLHFGRFVDRSGQRVTFSNGHTFVVGLAPDDWTYFDEVTGLQIPIYGEYRITMRMIANYTQPNDEILAVVKKDASSFLTYVQNRTEVHELKIVLNFDKSM
jgi:hypothetical protein